MAYKLYLPGLPIPCLQEIGWPHPKVAFCMVPGCPKALAKLSLTLCHLCVEGDGALLKEPTMPGMSHSKYLHPGAISWIFEVEVSSVTAGMHRSHVCCMLLQSMQDVARSSAESTPKILICSANRAEPFQRQPGECSCGQTWYEQPCQSSYTGNPGHLEG